MRSAIFPSADQQSHPPKVRWLGSPMYWLFQLGGWGLLWFVLTLGTFASDPTQVKVHHEIAAQSFFLLSCMLCSHLLRVLVLWLRHLRIPPTRFIAGVVVAIAMASAAAIGPYVYWSALAGDPGDMPASDDYILPVLVFWFGISLILGVWVCFYFGYHYFRRYQQSTVERLQLAASVQEAELRALRSQVNPHFLFNSLNTLRALIPRELERPREAVTLLADLLRASLTVSQQDTLTLEQELQTVENHIALEQLRFEERLRVRFAIAPETRAHRLPPLALQTLVENAIKFGVAPFEEGGELSISAREHDGALEISVRNRGRLAPENGGTGVGLKNTRARLQLLFGPSASLSLSQQADDVVALMRVPLAAVSATPFAQ